MHKKKKLNEDNWWDWKVFIGFMLDIVKLWKLFKGKRMKTKQKNFTQEIVVEILLWIFKISQEKYLFAVQLKAIIKITETESRAVRRLLGSAQIKMLGSCQNLELNLPSFDSSLSRDSHVLVYLQADCDSKWFWCGISVVWKLWFKT